MRVEFLGRSPVTIGKSSEARANIMGRIRKAQGRGPGSGSEAQLAAVRSYLEAHPRGPLPDVGGDLVARFRARAESMQSTTEEVAAEADVPAAVARYLGAHKLPVAGCVWPALAHLDWRGAGLALEARPPRRENGGEDLVGVTGAFAGVAETGTLMVVSGPETPASTSLLPETHVAVLHAGRILPHMEEAWDLARKAFGQFPRAINFISGPSRTGDIEQQLVLGAHGPYRVHIVIVSG
jgi:L-lactate dehydrogenase complex protein LldG